MGRIILDPGAVSLLEWLVSGLCVVATAIAGFLLRTMLRMTKLETDMREEIAARVSSDTAAKDSRADAKTRDEKIATEIADVREKLAQSVSQQDFRAGMRDVTQRLDEMMRMMLEERRRTAGT